MKKAVLIFLTFFFVPAVAADVWDGYPVILWTEQGVLVNTDGRNGVPDVERTVAAMHDIGATAFYVHVKRQRDFDKAKSYLEKFKDTDIKTWIVTNGHCYGLEPYPKDCKSWAKEIATLSLTYPNLEAYTLDDYDPAKRSKTPDEIQSIIAEKNVINPELKIIPTFYSDVRDEIEYFKSGTDPRNRWEGKFKDGTAMWYWATYKANPGPSMVNFKDRLDECKKEIPPIPFITGIYALWNGKHRKTHSTNNLFHDPSLLHELVAYAKENSDGIGLFNFPIYVHDVSFLMKSTMFQQQVNDDASFDHMISSPKSTFVSWYQAIQTKLPVADSKNIRVQFDMKDTLSQPCEPSNEDYQYKQLLINGKVIWESDVCEDGKEKFSVDKIVAVSAPSASIGIRLFSFKSNHMRVKVYVDNLQVSLDGKKVPAQWTFDSNLANLDDYVATYQAVTSALKGKGGGYPGK